MIKLLLSATCIIFFSNKLQAQPDGSFPSLEFISELKKNLTDERSIAFEIPSIGLSADIPVILHVIKSRNDNSVEKNSYYQNIFNQVNILFKPLNMRFKLIETEIVEDYNYSYLSRDDRNMTELLKKHYVQQKLNIYFVDELMIDSSKFCGISNYPTDKGKDYIFITKKFSDGNTVASMLGHYMGLLSTHERSTGEEFVNGSNCANTGDLICDTYSDPNLFSKLDNECQFNKNIKDSKGTFYTPTVANIMSNSNPECKCIFTFEQYRRMYYYYIKYRQYLK